MNTSKKYLQWIGYLSVLIFLASCSTVSEIPNDDVYYSKKVKNNGEYDWNDFQKHAQTFGDGNSNSSGGTATGGEVIAGGTAASSSDIATTVEGGDANADNRFIDEYYDDTYAERINRFDDNSSNSGFDYYDGYNTNSG